MFKLFRFLKPYTLPTVLLILTTGVQVWTTLRLPALMARIINEGIATGNVNRILEIGRDMIILALISAICSLVSSFLSSKIGAGFAKDLRTAVFKKVLSFNLSDLKTFSTASLTNRTTNDITQIQDTVIMILSMMLRAPLFCVIAIIMAIQTAPDMAWIIAVGVGTILLAAISIILAVVPKFNIFQKLFDKITLITRENLTGLKVVRAFNNEKIERAKFDETNTELTKIMIFVDKIMKLQNPIINFIFNGATLLCTYIGITLLSKDFAYLGNMSAFSQYVTQVMLAFLMLSILFVMLPRANVAARRVNEVLNTKSKIDWKESTEGIPAKKLSVEFRNVDFRYPDSGEKVLSGISFTAKVGETTAFIGSTGSGKSTLINLIPRFYEPTAGEILINGINLKNYQKKDLMKRIGFVPQKGILFSGTIADNIKFGAPNATNAEIRAATRIAQAENFIEKFPKKYETLVSQGGTNVSGGQKQRLSIARAICKNPDIFIFDDSFSALDMKTDLKLRQALKPITEDMVVLIVAQRVNTIKDADQIVVLDNGKIAGKGKHLELLYKSTVYRDIVKSQLSSVEFEAEMKKAEKEKLRQKSSFAKSKESKYLGGAYAEA